MIRMQLPFTALSACLAAAGLVSACGGSDSPAATTTTVSGSVVKGPVVGSTVCAYEAASTGKGSQIKCATTGSAGAYTMDLAYTGDVVLEATGGTYTDEATNTAKTLTEPMQVVVSSRGGVTTGVVTPLTSAAYSVSKGLAGGVSSANFSTAATSVASQFQLSSVNLATTVPVVTGSTNSYGAILRAVSQFLANGNTQASLQAFATPAALQAGFASAYATINGTALTFTFNGTTTTVTGGTGTSTGTGTTAGTSGDSCGITVAGSGSVVASGFTVPFTLPATKICISGVPASSCTAGNAQLQSLAAGGATPAGNYTLSYTYSYAPGDCSGAVATVAFK
ncbi:MAG: hypothetical protein HYX47_05450 [Burkholderiales bacterium]|nr:hypothetical protein [Burkholderiales bacterium]